MVRNKTWYGINICSIVSKSQFEGNVVMVSEKKLISQLKSQLLGYFLKKFFEKVRIKKAIKYYYIHNPNSDR